MQRVKTQAVTSGPDAVPGVGRCHRDQDKRVRWRLGTASGVYLGMLCFGKNSREKPTLSLATGKQVLADSEFIYFVVTGKDKNRVELGQKAPFRRLHPHGQHLDEELKRKQGSPGSRGGRGAVARLLGTRKAPGKPGERLQTPPPPAADQALLSTLPPSEARGRVLTPPPRAGKASVFTSSGCSRPTLRMDRNSAGKGDVFSVSASRSPPRSVLPETHSGRTPVSEGPPSPRRQRPPGSLQKGHSQGTRAPLSGS